MAARMRSIRRGRKANRDLVWITTVVRASLLETTPTDIAEIVVPADWSLASVGFDRCTLMGIRGCLSWNQSAAGTGSEAPGFIGAAYVTDNQVTLNSFNPADASEYTQFDTIWTFAGAGANATSTLSYNLDLDIKAKRKLTSAQDVRLCVNVFGDTAANPRFGFAGIIRALVMLDPPK